jgi:hypothetical protein
VVGASEEEEEEEEKKGEEVAMYRDRESAR